MKANQVSILGLLVVVLLGGAPMSVALANSWEFQMIVSGGSHNVFLYHSDDLSAPYRQGVTGDYGGINFRCDIETPGTDPATWPPITIGSYILRVDLRWVTLVIGSPIGGGSDADFELSFDGTNFSLVYDNRGSTILGAQTHGWTAGEVQVFIDQLDQNNQSVGTVNRWYRGEDAYFESVPLGRTYNIATNSTQVYQGDQSLQSGQKYWKWTVGGRDVTDLINHRVFIVGQGFGSSLVSHLNLTYDGAEFVVDCDGVSGSFVDSIYFRDPWLIDYNDAYGTRNQGTSAQFKGTITPFYPNYATRSTNNDLYLGVISGQVPGSSLDYYSVRIPLLAQIQSSPAYFLGWASNSAATLYQPDPSPPNYDQKAVVLSAANALITAHYKGHFRTGSTDGIGFNTQRKLVVASGRDHMVYQSASEIWYTFSTDNGATWQPEVRLSDGSSGSAAPCLAKSGSSLLVSWQQQAGSSFNIEASRSTNGGSTWIGPVAIASGVSCTSPGPLPSISGATTNAAFLSYATSSGLACQQSNNAGQNWNAISAPGSGNTAISPSTGMNKYSTWHTISVGHLAYASNTPANNPSIMYNSYDYSASAWGTAVNISSIVPGSNLGHEKACLAVSGDDGCLTVHVAWDALDPGNPSAGNVILYRKRPGSTGVFENQYTLIRYQGLVRPSITGLATDNAWMVYQSQNGTGVMWKDHYFLSGSNWGWGNPTSIGVGFNPQISAGSTSAKYVWTTGSSAPYQLNTSSETLSKEMGVASWKYMRALNLIDTSARASLSIEIGDVTIRKANGQIVQAPFAETVSDSSPVTPATILAYGTSNVSAVLSTSDTLEVTYSVIASNALQLLTPDSKGITINLEKPGTVDGSVAIVQRTASALEQNQARTTACIPLVLLPSSLWSSGSLRLEVSVTGIKDNPNLIGSLGHIYQGIDGEGLGKAPAPEIDRQEAPMRLGLLPSYPNPFNPTTTIAYNLPQKEFVLITVFNALGQPVATLVNGSQEAGYHQVEFDGSSLASGVYFCRMKAGDYIATKKLLFVK